MRTSKSSHIVGRAERKARARVRGDHWRPEVWRGNPSVENTVRLRNGIAIPRRLTQRTFRPKPNRAKALLDAALDTPDLGAG